MIDGVGLHQLVLDVPSSFSPAPQRAAPDLALISAVTHIMIISALIPICSTLSALSVPLVRARAAVRAVGRRPHAPTKRRHGRHLVAMGGSAEPCLATRCGSRNGCAHSPIVRQVYPAGQRVHRNTLPVLVRQQLHPRTHTARSVLCSGLRVSHAKRRGPRVHSPSVRRSAGERVRTARGGGGFDRSIAKGFGCDGCRRVGEYHSWRDGH